MKKFKSGRLISTAVLLAILSLVLVLSALAIGSSLAPAPQLHIAGTNLSFSDSIYIKYAVSYENVSQYEDIKLLVWTEPEEGYTFGTQDAILSFDGTVMIGEDECLVFDYTDIAAKEMTDYIYARAYYKSGNEEYYSDVKKYSVLTYVYNKLGYTGTPTTNEDLAALLRGLLEYGASAQDYFNYKEDALATDEHVKVTLENGVFADGFNTTLAIPGTRLTVTASATNSDGSFIYWTDAQGNILSPNPTYEITVGNTNTTLSAVYVACQGGDIDGAGANLSADSFALTEHTVDTDNATEITASSLQSQLSRLTSGSVYIVTDGNTLNITSSVYGNGAVIIAPAGIRIDSQSNITIQDLILIGSVSVKSPNGISFNRVEVQSTETAVTVDSASKNVTFDDCRIISDTTAISTSAFNTSVKNSYISADSAVVSTANETTVYNCSILANAVGVSATGSDNAINNNDITAATDAHGIVIGSSSLNSLLSYNKIIGSKNSITVSDATNTVVLFNSCYNVVADKNTNTYVVENSLGGQLVLTDNNYLLCDANAYVGNSDHTPSMSGNGNVNGDSLMDVDARDDIAGADENLLPHTNKDLFLDMEKKDTVKDIANGTAYSLDTYIEENAKKNSIVIVPPGAYTTKAGDDITLVAEMSNTEIYAFGVYNEHGFNTNAEFLAGAAANSILGIYDAQNVTVHGITMGYDYQASGQVHVLDKLGNNQILVVPAAGYDLEAGFGKTNPGVFEPSNTTKFKKGELYPSTEGSFYNFKRKNDDGTIVLELTADGSHTVEENYKAMDIGDIITCRLAGNNQHTVAISNTTNVKLKDMVLYGYSAALMIVVTGNATDTSLERVHNTARAPYVIDKDTYDLYATWQTQYGADLEIYQDELGRYRGAQPRIGSVDATHISGASEGLDITSCLFENMCDDGSNQHGTSYRLADIKDNGDGTTTLYYKGMVTSIYYTLESASGNKESYLTPISFAAGDRIYVYTSKGELVCDTDTLEASRDESDLTEIYDLSPMRYFIYVKSVKVRTASVNFDALEGYDLSDNYYSMTNKVIVDNISHSGEGFVIDNLMVRNSTARGVLIKTINSAVKNSTFRNVPSAGNLLCVETNWGESTVSRNIVISKCLFDNTGFDASQDIQAPIAISGLSTYGNANVDTLRLSDILIEGCEFKDYRHSFGIYVNGAQGVRIIDNVFDPKDSADPGKFIKIVTAIDIEIEGNKYRNSNGNLTTISGIYAEDYAYIHGSDVGNAFSAKCDVYIGENHLSKVRVYPADDSYYDVAKMMAANLRTYCGYAVSSSNFFNENVIKLIVDDASSELVSSNTYTVTCDGQNLEIRAATRASLIYAVDDFVNYIKELNTKNQTITFSKGYSKERTFTLKTISATNTTTLKYSGFWNASGTSMISAADADYVEFDISGSTVTLLFSAATECDISIDGGNYETYTINSEKTFFLENGEHTFRILAKDTSKKVSFAGVECLDAATISRTENKEHYIQFIGDSMVGGDDSFAHNLGNVLDWDYSVLVGDTLPSTTNIGRTPDVFVIFLGTDAITSSSTSAEISTFKSTYKSLVESIISKYPSCKKIYLMQALSTSDATDMFNTSHNRYSAIASIKSDINNSKVKLIDASTVQGWGIEFNTSVDTTNPTYAGSLTLLAKLSSYIAKDLGSSDYVNVTFDQSKMENYNGTWTKNVVENGVTFNHYEFDRGAHVFISGTNWADVPTNSGRYLVIKYRTSGNGSLSIDVRTNDYGTDQDESNHGYVSFADKPSYYTPTDWEIAVVDLAQFAHYTTGIDTKVQIRMTTLLSTLDIAHASIVDDLTEARLLIASELRAKEYMMYENWSEKGVRTSIDGSEITEPDLSFVNHNFELATMEKFANGSGWGFPDEIAKTDADGVVYNHFTFTQPGHITLKGTNALVPINGDTGKYLVLKYRAQNNESLSLEMQTSHLPFDSSNAYVTLSWVTKPASNVSTKWEVAVIDLAQFTNYRKDADLDVLIRITTSCEFVDIAYAAIVDDTAEAESYISIMGDSTYVRYTDWAGVGTTTTIK